MAEPTEGPPEYEDEKALDEPIMDVLNELSDPESILFVAKSGRPGALMTNRFYCRQVPHKWIQRLVQRAYIDIEVSSRNKVACMGWVQYVITYDGQQALNRRYREWDL